MRKFKEYISAVSDGESVFKDIFSYEEFLAHNFFREIPIQKGGCGCAIHCLSFAANLMSGVHVRISDFQTKYLRVMFAALLNSTESFGPDKSHAFNIGHNDMQDCIEVVQQDNSQCITNQEWADDFLEGISELFQHQNQSNTSSLEHPEEQLQGMSAELIVAIFGSVFYFFFGATRCPTCRSAE